MSNSLTLTVTVCIVQGYIRKTHAIIQCQCFWPREALALYNGIHFPDVHTLKDVIEGFDAHFVRNGLTRHMSAKCSTTATTVLMNLLKITLLYFALFQRPASFVTA